MTKKIQSTQKIRASALAVAAGLAFSSLPLTAQAAGLGKVTVFSALGQPLRAEVELSATREELASMKASLASPDAFKAAGLDYTSPLQGIRFAIDKRPSGQSVIKLSTDRPLNEPFVDMLLEINWPAGRLVREYTFLLDPPEVMAKAAAPVAAPEAKPVASKPAAKSAPAPMPAPVAPITEPPAEPKEKPAAKAKAKPAVEAEVKPAAEAKTKPAAKPKVEERAEAPADSQPTGEGDKYAVKKGDNLRKIAAEAQQQVEGVSLDQMLVGLFWANKDAFDGGNMNRLKSGKILTVPSKSDVDKVAPAEAQKIVVAQAADWNAYRRNLAAGAAQAPATDEAGKQESAGKITAKVEDKAAPAAETKDQVRVSRTESGKGKPGGKVGEEELIAKEKALKEANERLASLEKNVNELQKLVELKNKNLAELQKQASKPAPAPEVKPEPPKPVEIAKPVEPPKAAEPVKPVEAPKVEEKKPEVVPVVAPVVEAAKPVEPPKAEEKKPEEAKPAEAPKPEEKKPEEAKPVEAPKPKPKAVIPEPPPEEPGLFEDPMLLAGGGGIVALLLGYVAYKRRRGKAQGGEVPLSSSTAGLSETSLGENSVFRTTGGQSVDTSHTPPQTDFSQAGPGTIDTDEVDPVAEADVYMAYGRDAQAEEILLEAKSKDPKRHAIHLKLLEIYANRQSAKQFETLATELYGETGGVGADWEKTAAMGLKVDPQNPLYSGKVNTAAASFDADATVIVSAQSMKNTVTMPGQLAQMAAAAEPVAAALPELPAADDGASLDFDLGPATTTITKAPEPSTEATLTLPQAVAPVAEPEGALDFDLGTGTDVRPLAVVMAAAAAAGTVEEPAVGLDFEMPEIKVEEPAAADAGGLDFDLGPESAAPAAEAVTALEAPAAAIPDISLDMGGAEADGLHFDVQLTESTVLGQPVSSPSFDMTSINLDLAEVKPAAVAAEPETEFESAQMATMVSPNLVASLTSAGGLETVGTSEEVATKLDLAKAYEEMGDMEGARELLQEVVKEGNAEQQAAARAILERVG